MKIKEVMSRDIKSLTPEISAKQALDILLTNQISGLPVIDAQGRLTGMFTEKNILSHILPSYLEKVGRFVYEDNPKGIHKKVDSLASIKVKDLMRQEVITVDQDATLCEAARIMLTQRIRRMPVLDKSGNIVGIVAREDVLKALITDAK